MRTNEEWMEDVLLYLHNLAELRPSNVERGILTGHRQVKDWETYDHIYKHYVSGCLSKFAKQIETAHEQGVYENSVINATKVFMYVFDKSFDLAYVTIEPSCEKVRFDIEEVGNDYKFIVPEKLQVIVNKVVPKIVRIGNNLYEFMKFEGHMKLPFHKWMFFYMSAANTLALSFFLQQDLDE
jgi:hypothetical protein